MTPRGAKGGASDPAQRRVPGCVVLLAIAVELVTLAAVLLLLVAVVGGGW